MTTPHYVLRNEHVATVGHMRTERDRNNQTYATKAQIDGLSQDTISSKTNPQSYLMAQSGNLLNGSTPLSMNNQKIKDLADATQPNDAMNKHLSDQSYLAKTTTLDAIPLPVANLNLNGKRLTAIGDAVGLSDAVSLLQLNGINESVIPRSGIRSMTGNLDLGSYKIINLTSGTLGTDSVNKTQLDLKADQLTTYTKLETNSTFKPIGQIESIIQNSTQKTKIACSGDNAIQITSNNSLIGTLYTPTGQSTTNQFGLLTPDKLTMQSQSSSFSLYGGKTPVTGTTTHQLVLGGRDDVAKNVQANINLGVGTSQLNLSSGHADLGTGQQNYSSVSADSSLLISGGTPLVDPMITCYSNVKATAIGTSLPIQVTGKTGYSSTTTIDQPNQFTSKTYVDTSTATKISKNGDTMTGNLILNADPTTNLGASTKQYVDTTSSTKISKAGDTMTGFLTLNADPTTNLGASTKQYVDNKVSGFTSGGITQNDADIRYFKTATTTLNDIPFPLSSYSMNAQKILNITDATTTSGVVSKKYIDDADNTLQTNITNGLALKSDKTYVDTNLLSKIGTTDQIVNSTVSMATGKKIVQPFYATQSTDLTNKQYVDDQVATRLPLSGGTISGNIVLSLAPTIASHAVNKAYADSLVSSSATQISTNAGYSIVTTANSLDKKKNNVTYETESLSLGNLSKTMTGVNSQQTVFTDNSSTSYTYLDGTVSQINTRPKILIQDIGNSGTQDIRITAQSNNGSGLYQNDTSIDLLPTQNKITINKPLFQSSTYVAPTTDQEYTQKKYVDDTILAQITGGIVSNKIKSLDSTFTATADNSSLQIDDTNLANDVYQLQLRPNQISNSVKGVTAVTPTLILSAGTTNLYIDGDSTNPAIKCSNRIEYANSAQLVYNRDQLISSRQGDGMYLKINGSNYMGGTLNMNGYGLFGVPTDLIANTTYANVANNMAQYAVNWANLKAYIDYRTNFMRSYSFMLTIGDVPSSVEQWQSTNGFITSQPVYTNTSASTGYLTVSVDTTKIFDNDDSDYIVLLTWASVSPSIDSSSVFTPMVTGYNRTSFQIYFRESSTLTQNNQLFGVLHRRNW